MSEAGWREFLAAEGVADWVVLHGGASAAYDVASLAAARLAEAVAQVPDIASSASADPRPLAAGVGAHHRGQGRLAGREEPRGGVADDNAVDPLGHRSTVWMQELDETGPLRHAMHVDVSVAREHLDARHAAALAAGGRIVDESNAPAHWTLADSAGNRVGICAWPDGSGAAGA